MSIKNQPIFIDEKDRKFIELWRDLGFRVLDKKDLSDNETQILKALTESEQVARYLKDNSYLLKTRDKQAK